MSIRNLALEDFGSAAAEDGAGEPGKSLDYHTGYEAGYDDGQIAAQKDQMALRHAFVAALEDLSFTHADATSHVRAALRPIFEQLVEQIVPTLIGESFAPHLLAALTDVVAAATDGPFILHVCPEQADIAQTILDQVGTEDVEIHADPTLALNSARIAAWNSETLLDLPSLTAALQEALRGLDTRKRSQSHG